jgi:two-component system NarL family sensor kinase
MIGFLNPKLNFSNLKSGVFTVFPCLRNVKLRLSMANNPGQYKRLLYEHEVLWAVFDIRDHYLNRIVQEVYENIGQVLSLVRVQLKLLANDSRAADLDTADPGSLVGLAIEDLRNMCRAFFPESELLGKSGLIDTLEYELELLGFAKSKELISVKGVPVSLETGLELIVFRILQEILISMEKDYEEFQDIIEVIYGTKSVTFILKGDHFSDVNDPSSTLGLKRLSVRERVELIGGKFEVRETRDHQKIIKLKVPFKTTIYD